MRWGDHEIRWIRPLRSILCLFDGEVVPVEFGRCAPAPPLAAIASSRPRQSRCGTSRTIARSWRLPTSSWTAPSGAGDRDRGSRLARDEDLRLRQDPALLAELAGLVEWPVALLGRIDQRFMALPEEVLVTAMRHHQKYLALEDADGRLAPRFVAVANLPTKDGRAVGRGQRARVARAPVGRAVLLGQGPEAAAREPVPELDGVVFHARLGSLGAKAARLEKLAGWIAQHVPEAKPELAAGQGCWPRPIWSPAWSASSRTPGHHGPALRAA